MALLLVLLAGVLSPPENGNHSPSGFLSAIVPKEELVKVDLELGAAYPVVSADEPLLQVTEGHPGFRALAHAAFVLHTWDATPGATPDFLKRILQRELNLSLGTRLGLERRASDRPERGSEGVSVGREKIGVIGQIENLHTELDTLPRSEERRVGK